MSANNPTPNRPAGDTPQLVIVGRPGSGQCMLLGRPGIGKGMRVKQAAHEAAPGWFPPGAGERLNPLDAPVTRVADELAAAPALPWESTVLGWQTRLIPVESRTNRVAIPLESPRVKRVSDE